MNYLSFLPRSLETAEIERQHKKKQQWVNQNKKGFLRYRMPYRSLADYRAEGVHLDTDTIIIGYDGEISPPQQEQVRDQLRAFMPWRKGPFSVFGIEIDAEWRSEKKWNRIATSLPDLEGKVIADIGCNNGYYMFRMAAARPKLVLGFEPSVQHYYCFKALNAMAGLRCLQIDLLGVEHLSLFPNCFDVIFVMGIIYHRPSPVDTLRNLLQALKPGGTLILETQAIPGETDIALFPERTYAKAPGVYFIPTASCLNNWLRKAGFVELQTLSNIPMSSLEQRRTDWMVFESYQDFVDPVDPTRTIEGYPAPLRVAVKATKKLG
jgi:tRNA (mo5U34)-methyltransferase